MIEGADRCVGGWRCGMDYLRLAIAQHPLVDWLPPPWDAALTPATKRPRHIRDHLTRRRQGARDTTRAHISASASIGGRRPSRPSSRAFTRRYRMMGAYIHRCSVDHARPGRRLTVVSIAAPVCGSDRLRLARGALLRQRGDDRLGGAASDPRYLHDLLDVGSSDALHRAKVRE